MSELHDMDVHTLARKIGENMVKITELAKQTEEMCVLLAALNRQHETAEPEAVGDEDDDVREADGLLVGCLAAAGKGNAEEFEAAAASAAADKGNAEEFEAAAAAADKGNAEEFEAAASAAAPETPVLKQPETPKVKETRLKIAPKLVSIPRGGQAANDFLRVKRKAKPSEEDEHDNFKTKRTPARLVDYEQQQQQQQQQNVNPNIKMPTHAEREAYKRKYLEQQGKMGVGRRPAWWANSEEKLSADRILAHK
jgi:hypothetical protein